MADQDQEPESSGISSPATLATVLPPPHHLSMLSAKRRIACPICYANKNGEDMLESHLAEEHLMFYPWLCCTCGFRRYSAEKMNQHCVQEHPNTPPSMRYVPNDEKKSQIEELLEKARIMRLSSYAQTLYPNTHQDIVSSIPASALRYSPPPSAVVEPPRKRYRIVTGYRPGARTQLRLTLAAAAVEFVGTQPASAPAPYTGAKRGRKPKVRNGMPPNMPGSSANAPSSTIQLAESEATASVTVRESSEPIDLARLIESSSTAGEGEGRPKREVDEGAEITQRMLADRIRKMCALYEDKSPQCVKCKEVMTHGGLETHIFSHIYNDRKMARYVCSFPGCEIGCHIEQLVQMHIQHEHSADTGNYTVIDALKQPLADIFSGVFKECFGHMMPDPVEATIDDDDEQGNETVGGETSQENAAIIGNMEEASYSNNSSTSDS